MRFSVFKCRLCLECTVRIRSVLSKLLDFLRHQWVRITVFITFLICVWPDRYAPHYPYIPVDEMYHEMVERTTQNITQQSVGVMNCDYNDVISENQYMYREPYISQLIDADDIRLGGEWWPTTCAPKFSTAVLVVYRNREKQLHAFLTYIHNFLRKQMIHYRIFVIEQSDEKPFNRAMLFNIGSVYASQLNFPCLILHDVDLMPMNLGNLYVCTKRSRHMCAALDKFRFNLLYYGLFGGAVSIETKVYEFINGMSNMFSGWGGEDDDLYGRLRAKNFEICRFSPDYSRYTMLKHKEEHKSESRVAFLRNGSLRYNIDGLNSLVYKEKEVKLHKLFTHIQAIT